MDSKSPVMIIYFISFIFEAWIFNDTRICIFFLIGRQIPSIGYAKWKYPVEGRAEVGWTDNGIFRPWKGINQQTIMKIPVFSLFSCFRSISTCFLFFFLGKDLLASSSSSQLIDAMGQNQTPRGNGRASAIERLQPWAKNKPSVSQAPETSHELDWHWLALLHRNLPRTLQAAHSYYRGFTCSSARFYESSITTHLDLRSGNCCTYSLSHVVGHEAGHT